MIFTDCRISIAVITVVFIVFLLLYSSPVNGDVYMHNPRGSNNRNCERDANRRNANRLFDSQNNAAGGYACPRPQGSEEEIENSEDPLLGGDKRMYYYEGSILPIQWTHQHSCDDPNARCEIIIQYACEDTLPGMRDGLPTVYDPANTLESRATETVPEDEEKSNDSFYGRHETYEYYKNCKARRRNTGLWIADQRIGENQPATRTRQNPGGTRYGFECPEERDYYPYWHPTPWKDIVVYTSDMELCEMYQEESENVKGRGQCVEEAVAADGTVHKVYSSHNNELSCTAADGMKDREGRTIRTRWVVSEPHGGGSPQCLPTSNIASRDNHLGNAGSDGADMPTFTWTVPTLPSGVESWDRCVIRIRYNITTGDIDPFNGTDSNLNGEYSPIKEDEVVDVGAEIPLEMAINTDQTGRTFQDRSYTFRIVQRPDKVKLGDEEINLPRDAPIYNVNVRGKRGNIVQTYPSVEYDFVPNRLDLTWGDWIHFQWTGSDYNPNRGPNDGEGGPPIRTSKEDFYARDHANSGADRTNLVATRDMSMSVPIPLDEAEFFNVHGTPDIKFAKRLAILDQDLETADENTRCMSTEELRTKAINKNNRNNAQRDPQNCSKLSGQKHPYFDGGLFMVRSVGEFSFMSTRNNNFSNRQQKLFITVKASNASRIMGQVSMNAIVVVMSVMVMALGLLF